MIRQYGLVYLLITALFVSSCINQSGKVSDLPADTLMTLSSAEWSADNGDGTFTNPILHIDYSDPDVIREGDEYYMVASSFNCVPGLPLLHSKDLVNWELIGYALNRQVPEEDYSVVRHGGGAWAPCLRYHKNEYYIYYPDPDKGIYLVRAESPYGPWSEPLLVKAGKGLIDPSPLWDDDGNAYLVYAFAGSRAGTKSVLIISRMNNKGTRVDNEGVMIFDGHPDNPTVEGPKFYKRNGYYYIFAPAGGVQYGWQLVLRSQSVSGPYEVRKVLAQGNSKINGPHQGAWITTQKGEDWFIHFQDKDAYGRIVHLQPMKWIDDWPVIGSDVDGDGTGEPVLTYTKPDVGSVHDILSPVANDEFDDTSLGLPWQWQANPSLNWGYPTGRLGYYRLNCIPRPADADNLWNIPNLLLQKFPAEEFVVTTSLRFNARFDNEETGFIVMGRDYQYISLKQDNGKLFLKVARCMGADKGEKEEVLFSREVCSSDIVFRVIVSEEAKCRFAYSTNGEVFEDAGEEFTALPGMWTGAKFGFFALREGFINDAGNVNINWLRIRKIQEYDKD